MFPKKKDDISLPFTTGIRNFFESSTIHAEEKENSTLQPDKKKPIFPKKKFVAGACAGCADVWVCHPLDRIKTHMQQHPRLNMFGSAKEIWVRGGIRSLYEGIWPMTVEAIVKVGLRFFTFTYFKDQYRRYILHSDDPTQPVGIMGDVLAGGMAGVVESLAIVIPCELLKVRHMTQAGHEPFLGVMRKVISEEGVLALYKGGAPTLLRQSTNQMIRFPIFVGASEYLKKLQKYPHDQALPTWQNLSVGGFAGMISTIINTPFDTIKTHLQKQGNNKGLLGTLGHIYKEGGLRAYWAGVVPRTVRVVPGQAITWAVFAYVAALLGED
jgi:solute carrier family 25 citrate transporter 1